VEAARLLQFALGVLNVALLWIFARRWFGAWPASIAALLAAIYWGFVYYEGELLEPVLLISLTWLFLLAMGRWHDTRCPVWLGLAGLALGASAAARPNALLLAPVAAAWVAWCIPTPRRWLRSAAPAVLALAAGCLLVIAPITLRNAIMGHDAVLISSNGGINLLLGQDRTAIVEHASALTGHWNCYDYPLLMEQAAAEAGRPLKASEASRHYAARARALARQRPRETLRLAWLKTLLFWGPLDVSNNKVEELERTDSAVLSRLPGRFSFILAAGLLGVGRLARRRHLHDLAPARMQMTVLLLAMTGVYFLSFLPFIAAGQYRTPLIPILLLFAGYGLAGIARAIRIRRWRTAAATLGMILVLWLLVRPNYTGYRLNPARFHLTRAIAAERAGLPDRAAEAYTAAIAANPRLAVAHNRLGALLARQERIPEALSCFESAVALDPASVEARFNLGLALALSGREEESVPHFEYVLRRNPAHADARRNLAMARERIAARPAPADAQAPSPSP
jgi:tetratricopeptide (TPR) repeat protein